MNDTDFFENSNDELCISIGKFFFAGVCLTEEECRFLEPLIDAWYTANDVTRDWWSVVSRYSIYDFEILQLLDDIPFTAFAQTQLYGNAEAETLLQTIHAKLSARLAPQSTLQWSS